MAERPRRAIPRPDYVTLASCNIKLPRRTKHHKPWMDSHGIQNSEEENKLYRLKVLEEDLNNNLVKVRYIGYSSEYDEWRLRDEIVDLSDDSSENDCTDFPASIQHFCLFQELALRIKSLLSSNRKGDPICRIIMSFDSISFDSLIVRSTALPKTRLNPRRQVYTIINVTKLEDLLGERWYIRGLNLAGDFCFITPSSVKFYLRHNKGRADYQIQSDGTMLKKIYGKGCQLIFSFVRGDGTSAQWSEIIKKCTSSK